MILKDLIIKTRSYRRFYEEVPFPGKLLDDMIEMARFSASAKNLQYFKFFATNDPLHCKKIFPLTGWAGFLKDWPGPEEGERPTAYIIVFHDKNIHPTTWNDQGIPVQSMMLGATEAGFGGCIIASINKTKLRQLLQIPEHLDIVWILALGKPKEEIVLDNLPENGDSRYWREPDGTHHVPKREINELKINLTMLDDE